MGLDLRPDVDVIFDNFGQRTTAIITPIGFSPVTTVLIEKSTPRPVRTFDGIVVQDLRPRVAIRRSAVAELPEKSTIEATLNAQARVWRVDTIEQIDGQFIHAIVSPIPVQA
jgi:hypothetical protein